MQLLGRDRREDDNAQRAKKEGDGEGDANPKRGPNDFEINGPEDCPNYASRKRQQRAA